MNETIRRGPACLLAAAILLSLGGARARADGAASQLVALPNARIPESGMLTGGQPTAAQLEQAAAAGFRTVINLRADGEDGELAGEAAIVADLGMRYVRIPMSGPADLTEANARLLAETLDAEGAGPILFHCASGNRVGALLALKAAVVDGVPAEQALALGKTAGLTRLEARTREMLGLPPANAPSP